MSVKETSRPGVAATSPPTTVKQHRRRRAAGATRYLFLLPAMAFLLVFLGYPIAVNVRFGFSDVSAAELLSGGHWAGLSNYRAILNDPHFAATVLHTIVFTLCSITAQLAVGLGLATIYNRSFPGASQMAGFYLIGWSAPIVAMGAVFRWLYDRQFGVINYVLGSLHVTGGSTPWLSDGTLALIAVILANIWIGIPFYVTFFLAALKGMPTNLYEAAEIDGANAFQRFRYITLPMLRPALLIGGVFGVIFTLKSFDLIWIMTQGGPLGATDTMTTLAYTRFFTDFNFGQGAAIMNLMLVATAVVAFIYLRLTKAETTK